MAAAEQPKTYEHELLLHSKQIALTWNQNGNGRLHSLSDDTVQGEHPVRLDVMIPKNFIDLERQ